MRYRRLGRTGLMVSEISLGTVELGMDYGIHSGKGANQPSETEAMRLLGRAVDSGINFIDTAAAYGTSEAIIGKALRGRRQEIFIATKCMHYMDQAASAPEIKRRIADSIDESLRRLQTDTIDVIQIHGRDRQELELRMLDEGVVIEALENARAAGKVRFVGYSSYLPDVSMAVLNQGVWDTLQAAYNLFDRRHAEEVIPAAYARDVGIIVRSALLKGALTDRAQHLPEHLKALAERTAKLQELLSPGIPTLPQLALRFVLSDPAVSTIVVGADRMTYLEEAVSVSDGAGLPADVLEAARTQALDDPDLVNPSRWGIP